MDNKIIPLFKKTQPKSPKAPKHLRAETRRWFEQVCKDYELESHHIMILTLAAEAWDRHLQAREGLAKNGMTFKDKFKNVKPRPEIMVVRDSTNTFARMLRELKLEEAPPEPPRPPALKR
jgi:phage terminase small subunit